MPPQRARKIKTKDAFIPPAGIQRMQNAAGQGHLSTLWQKLTVCIANAMQARCVKAAANYGQKKSVCAYAGRQARKNGRSPGSVHAPLNDALRFKSSLAKASAAAMRCLARLATQAMAF